MGGLSPLPIWVLRASNGNVTNVVGVASLSLCESGGIVAVPACIAKHYAAAKDVIFTTGNVCGVEVVAHLGFLSLGCLLVISLVAKTICATFFSQRFSHIFYLCTPSVKTLSRYHNADLCRCYHVFRCGALSGRPQVMGSPGVSLPAAYAVCFAAYAAQSPFHERQYNVRC